jgi:hypothetical protein
MIFRGDAAGWPDVLYELGLDGGLQDSIEALGGFRRCE